MIRRASYPKMAGSRWELLDRISGAAAIFVGLFLLIAVVSLIVSGGSPISGSRLLYPFENNWLVVIFKLHAGFSGVTTGQLQGVPILDVAILALFSIVSLGLFAARYPNRRILLILALVQPFLGLVILFVTQTAGRSAVMGATLLFSIALLGGKNPHRTAAIIGIVASVMLFVGDLTAGRPPSGWIAALFGAAYLLFIAWLFLVARQLIWPRNPTESLHK